MRRTLTPRGWALVALAFLLAAYGVAVLHWS